MYICVDFDGTIVDHVFPRIGQAAPKALYFLKKFQENGGKIILFTMRSDGNVHKDGGKLEGRMVLTEAVDYIKQNGIELYGVNVNPDQLSWTLSPKAYGQVYIDDAAFGCPLIHPDGFNRPCVDWQTVGTAVLGILLRGAEIEAK